MLVAWIVFILLGAAFAAWAGSWLPVAVAGVLVAGFFSGSLSLPSPQLSPVESARNAEMRVSSRFAGEFPGFDARNVISSIRISMSPTWMNGKEK